MESDCESEESYISSDGELLDDELSDADRSVDENVPELQITDSDNELEEDSLSEESDSSISDESASFQTKCANHSDTGRCDKIKKFLQKEDWAVRLERLKRDNDELSKSVQYHDINDMMPVDGKFLVDADSLLIFALSEEEWGGRQHGQMLHVIYICERILNVFTRIGGVCEMVFFQSWETVWSDQFLALARTSLMAHFKYNTDYAVHIVRNAWDDSFRSVVELTKPNFLLQYLDLQYSNLVPNCCSELAEIMAQVNINFIVASGVSCVDLSGISLSISTINAFVTGPKRRIQRRLLADCAELLNQVLYENAADAVDEIEVPSSILDIRRGSFVSAAAAVLVAKSEYQNLVRVFLLKCALIEVLPLKSRACRKVELGSLQVKESVALILRYLNRALDKILKSNAGTPLVANFCGKVADMWQGNFFSKLLTTLDKFVLTGPSDLGKETADTYLSLVDSVNTLCDEKFDPFPVNVSKMLKDSTATTSQRREAFNKVERQFTHSFDLENILPSTSQLMGEFCGESVLQNCWNAREFEKVYPLICRNRDFKEIYHWHSKKILCEDTKRVTNHNLSKKELMYIQKGQAKHAYFMQYYGNNLEGNKIVSEPIVRETQKRQQSQKSKKENKLSNNAKKIIKENERKRKQEILKEEYAKLKGLESTLKGDIKQDMKLRISTVKHFMKTVTSDAVKHETEMLLANLYHKWLKYDKKSRLGENFIDFFLLLRNVCLSCKKRIENFPGKSQASSVDGPKVTRGKKSTKPKQTEKGCKSEGTDEVIGTLRDLNKIWSYFHFLNLGEIAAKCKESIKSGGKLPDEMLDEAASCGDVLDVGVGFSWAQFQLNYLGPHLERESSGDFDQELGFAPDAWQAQLIAAIRKRQSAVVVAPTSSGKTYASYYCMKSVLKESVDGVVVYVSPTKALVNQVAATVYARFRDTVMADGMCLLGVFTRDYRQNADNCQILVTVPECLEIFLLSPPKTRWVSKVRYVIFDEIHCLSGIAGGISWESGLLLSRCPFLALSATIERPEVLKRWLEEASEYKKQRDVVDGGQTGDRNYDVKLITHAERHNDLEKHVFADGQLTHVHPYTFLTRKIILQHAGVPKTLTLSAKETLQLYAAMDVVIRNEITDLVPEIFFSSLSRDGFITKQEVRRYESALNERLYTVAETSPECFQSVLTHLSAGTQTEIQGTICTEELVLLVETLRKNKMLPAIVFSYDRKLVHIMFGELTKYYASKGDSSEEERESSKVVVEPKTMRKGKEAFIRNRKEFPSLNLLSSKNSIGTTGVADSYDIEYIERRLRRDGLHSGSPFVGGLRCGIGMHHGGMSRNKRTAVEMMFRMRLLNVVFATGTLALGIHMPCKTVVIAGETRYLNVINYHQMAGRAGRRGFDTKGDLVFWDVSHGKISNLMTAKLPVMWGNLPMTVSVILRLLLLVSRGVYGGQLTDQERNSNVSRALTFLNCNLVYQHYPELKQQMKHYFAFTNQLLMVQQLLDYDGNPQYLAGIVTHLHYHEPGNLVFVYLLRHGIFNKICQTEGGTISKQTELDLILVLSHLFTHTPLRKRRPRRKYKNSRVVLDEMPEFVVQEIEKYNEEVLLVFDNYFKCVAKKCQEQFGEDVSLPLSGVSFGPCKSGSAYSSFEGKLLDGLEEPLICSSFAALSGHGDVGLYSPESLVSTIRHQVFTDMKILPDFKLNQQLNGYAWDFYNHGISEAILLDNNLKLGDDFTLLKDFNLVLRTLYTSLSEIDEFGENNPVVEAFRIVSEKFSALFFREYGR